MYGPPCGATAGWETLQNSTTTGGGAKARGGHHQGPHSLEWPSVTAEAPLLYGRDGDSVTAEKLANALVGDCLLGASTLESARARHTLRCDGRASTNHTGPDNPSHSADCRRLRERLDLVGLPDASVPMPQDCLQSVLKSEDTVNVESDLTVTPYDVAKLKVVKANRVLVNLADVLQGDDLACLHKPHGTRQPIAQR